MNLAARTLAITTLGLVLLACRAEPTAQPPTPSPTARPQVEGTEKSTPVADPFGDSEPFPNVPGHPNERFEAKGALQWLPWIKRAVGETVQSGLLREDERQLWENVLLGMVGVESTGKVFLVGNAGSDWYSQGLTQLTYPATYREEDSFDPLTNLRGALRVTIRYYRHWGNRWDRAVAQHLTGAEAEDAQRTARDGAGLSGEDYARRVVNVVWWAHRLAASGDTHPPRDATYQAECRSCWLDRAPLWSIWDSPDLTFNWTPPSSHITYRYLQVGADGNARLPASRSTWVAAPDWLYEASPAPKVTAFVPRPATPDEARAYPPGRTAGASHAEGYPRRVWSVDRP